jgi:hypothetical protein
MNETATTTQHGPATKRRVIFTDTRWWAADVAIETADRLLHEQVDIIDVAEEFTRIRRCEPHGVPVEADLTVEAAAVSFIASDEYGVIDGTGPEEFYWSARKAVMEARYHLNCGRYREGDCREMDAVNASLGRIEEELRVLALAVDAERKEGDRG